MLEEWMRDRPEERFQHIWRHEGHLLGLVGGTLSAPFEPKGEVPVCTAKPPKWPLPSTLVSEGRFLDDEWVYDPSLAGRVIANDYEALAVKVAEHLITGNGKTVLIVTGQRIAVIIQERYTREEKSLLNRFRKTDDEDTGKKPVVWWQAGRSVIRDLPEVRYGRELGRPKRFRTVVFTDGSALELAKGDDW
ncbi:hypothetical protein Lesp02_76280 [Lentzea sp. NBRC 105346]|uniref:hypothetical protein n=1 Tax=Lentzea sp. NBRC 105346 TaxID=3032205 RepID=UPI0024A059D4|nr:hypothetical protein [Lentzea sp. NBRC 105346]GLZ35441.1 hypothetical protein Lesp02_76280 [Lentzea sp. NBRC 105346]